MLTIAEAMQRAAINGLVIRRAKPPLSLAWCVTLIEDKNDDNAYITDDLEDAVLMGAKMRDRKMAQSPFVRAFMGYDWVMDSPIA